MFGNSSFRLTCNIQCDCSHSLCKLLLAKTPNATAPLRLYFKLVEWAQAFNQGLHQACEAHCSIWALRVNQNVWSLTYYTAQPCLQKLGGWAGNSSSYLYSVVPQLCIDENNFTGTTFSCNEHQYSVLIMSSKVKRVYKWFAPDAEKEEDGRDKWPSRTAFVLAAMVSLNVSET